MSDTLSLEIRWGLRTETAGQCARRLAEMMAALASVHPGYERLRWTCCRKGLTAETADHGGMEALIEPQRIYDEVRKRRFPDGFALEAVTHLDDGSFLHLMLHVGRDAEAALQSRGNNVQINVGIRSRDIRPSLLHAMVPTLHTMASVWQPQYGRIWYYFLGGRSRTAGEPPRFEEDCWAFYLDARHNERVSPPPSALVKPRENGGLLIATKEQFEPLDPAHVEAAEALQAAVASLDLPW